MEFHPLSSTDFQTALDNTYASMHSGGTSYRQETVRLAIEVTKQKPNVFLFAHMHSAIDVVKSVFGHSIDEERCHDVAKLLHVIFKDLVWCSKNGTEEKVKTSDSTHQKRKLKLKYIP
ncbi:MAG: hypothetical protein ACRC5C_03070 [Bacilli bacterium]